MKTNLLLTIIFIAAVSIGHAQEVSFGPNDLTAEAQKKTPQTPFKRADFSYQSNQTFENNRPLNPFKTENAPAASLPQTNPVYTRPDAEKRFKRYIKNTIGPGALASSAAIAGFSTAANSPEEWGGQWEGFGRRFGSRLGENAIRNTVIYGLDEAFEVDSEFYRSEKKDIGSRVNNALLSTVTARRPDGTRTIGIPRLVGTYTSNIIAREAWYPDRYDYKDGLRSGTISLGINAVFNLFREFVWK